MRPKVPTCWRGDARKKPASTWGVALLSRNNLKVVDHTHIDDGAFDVLLVRPGGSAVFRAQERENAPVPLIGLRCAEYYRSTGCLMWAGRDYGMQIGVIVSVIWKGRKIEITGPAVMMDDSLDLILPRGTLP